MDKFDADAVLRAVRECAASWHWEVRVMGDVRAGDLVRAIDEKLAQDDGPVCPVCADEACTHEPGCYKDAFHGETDEQSTY